SVPFFFSSRRRHTRFSRDWSSDVCSSDLRAHQRRRLIARVSHHKISSPISLSNGRPGPSTFYFDLQRISPKRRRRAKGDPGKGRSEERRVGKEGRSRLSSAPLQGQEPPYT